MQPDFWQGKRVFLTGHTGFKGSWLSLWLTMLGAKVTGYALTPPTEPNLFAICGIAQDVDSLHGDVRDLAALTTALKNAKPDIVIHMAAQSLVRLSYQQPVETYSTNIMGTVYLLDAVRQHGGVMATLIVTSDKCYENREQTAPYFETDPMGGHDPYSSSKGAAELVTRAYGTSYFATENLGSLASVRAGNVIGGGDWAVDRLVPDIMRALIRNEAPLIRYPTAIRPWQHVLEPLSGYLTAIEHGVVGNAPVPDAWNFAPAPEGQVSVGSLAQGLCTAWGGGIQPRLEPETAAPHEAHLLTLDASKATRELGWHPRWNLESTLAHTVDWYRGFAEGTDMRKLTIAQIEAYNYTGA